MKLSFASVTFRLFGPAADVVSVNFHRRPGPVLLL